MGGAETIAPMSHRIKEIFAAIHHPPVQGKRVLALSRGDAERIPLLPGVAMISIVGAKSGEATNAIESVNAQLRKIIKTRGHFPNDDAAATKLIWLASRNITASWSRSAHDWKTAMNQFAILYADRFVQTAL